MGIRVERPEEFLPALDRACAANRPVIIDVVTDIEAQAPLAVYLIPSSLAALPPRIATFSASLRLGVSSTWSTACWCHGYG